MQAPNKEKGNGFEDQLAQNGMISFSRMLPIPDTPTDSGDDKDNTPTRFVVNDASPNDKVHPVNNMSKGPGNKWVAYAPQVTTKKPNNRFYYDYHVPARQTRYFNSFAYNRRSRNNWHWRG